MIRVGVRVAPAVRRLGVFLRLLHRHSPRHTTFAVLAAIASGLLTIATMLAAGQLLGATTDLIHDVGAVAAVYTSLAVFTAVVTLSGLIACLLAPLSLVIRRDLVVGALSDLTHIATSTELPAADDPDTAATLGHAGRTFRDWTFLTGLQSTWGVVANRLAAVGSMVVVGVWFLPAPILLVGSWLWLGRTFTRWSIGLGEMIETRSHGLRRAEYYRRLLVTTESAKEVRLFGLQRFIADRFQQAWLVAMRDIWAQRRQASRSVLLAVAVVAAANLAVLTLLAWQAASGTTPIGQVASTTLAILALGAFGIQDDNEVWHRHAYATLTRFERFRRELTKSHTDRALRAAVRGKSARSVELALAVECVAFAYPGSAEPVLVDLDLHVAPGQAVAIVGRNGSGKSTLIKLVCGLYVPDRGRIRIGDLSATDIRRSHPGTVSVVLQDFIQFPLSLFENVQLAFPDAAESDVHAAIRQAGLQDIVSRLPRGVHTILSSGYEGGQDLSGGQWQRVVLARACLAVICGAELIILDEPTAALDVDAEREFFLQFLEITRRCTTLVVTHRLSSVRDLDRIVVLRDGRIAEDGRHDDLLAAGGTYARMFSLQAQRYSQRKG